MRDIRKSMFIASVSIFVFVQSSCRSHIDDRPKSWQDPKLLENVNQCPDISGTYNNEAYRNSYLFDALTKEGIIGSHTCTYCPVRVRWLDSGREKLEVSITIYNPYKDQEKIVKETLIRSKDFRCENGKILIDYVMGFEGVVEGMIQKGTRSMYPGADGSILCIDKHSIIGHFLLFIPMLLPDNTDYITWRRSGSPYK